MVTRIVLADGNEPSLAIAQSLLRDQSTASRRWWDGALPRLLDAARLHYADSRLSTGEPTLSHGLSMARSAQALGLDIEACVAAVLFALADFIEVDTQVLTSLAGEIAADDSAACTSSLEQVSALVQGLARLKLLRPLIQAEAGSARGKPSANSQAEVLRKMLLAMSSDIRVVLLRLVSRTQSLRFYTTAGDHPAARVEREAMARETLAVYAPLANRLGVWQLKWEMEDLSFRFLEPELYKRIAGLLDEKRGERERFMEQVIGRLRGELATVPELAGVEVVGRPKHIYSIWNKMRSKGLAFEQLYDVRALRVIVPQVRDCYTVLGIVHQLWQPIRGEFDDYISHPKGNDYRSLHTAVLADEARSLEVQIRTEEMHRHAELGVAAHWRYKEAGHSAKAEGAYEDKIAWLRQLLSWREDITEAVSQSAAAVSSEAVDWVSEFRRAALDDTIYVMTPHGRVIDLPKGATPLDFAYRVHTDLGNRCRGARINGQMVPLMTPLTSGQTVDIITTKIGGPSRDWLMPGYLVSQRARQKVRQWFAAQDAGEQLALGRTLVQRELQRLGETQTALDQLAERLGLASVDAMFIAMARGDITARALALALRGEVSEAPPVGVATVQSRARARSGQVLVVGVDNLLTQMGRCCKPIPPDAIVGYVTRGRGVSVHRLGCRSFENMAARNPERVISAEWGAQSGAGTIVAGTSTPTVYAVDLLIEAIDRHDLLRDISDVLTRERIAVTAMSSRSRAGVAYMTFTIELPSSVVLHKIVTLLHDVRGVAAVRRP